jgi:predicted permease
VVALVDAVLAAHLIWIAWVALGALWTRGRPRWTVFHILAIVWGIIAEVGPWPCPLTLAENWGLAQAGMQGFHGGFLEHSLEEIVYPNLPVSLIATCAVVVCAVNLGIYAGRGTQRWREGRDS